VKQKLENIASWMFKRSEQTTPMTRKCGKVKKHSLHQRAETPGVQIQFPSSITTITVNIVSLRNVLK